MILGGDARRSGAKGGKQPERICTTTYDLFSVHV
jgi:hypothetical protein